MDTTDNWKSFARFALGLIAITVFCLLIKITHHQQSKKASPPIQASLQLPKTATPHSNVLWNKPIIHWQTFTIKANDSLSQIFTKAKLPYSTLQTILYNKIANQYLSKIKPGQTLHFDIDKQHQLKQLKYTINDQSSLLITKNQQVYNARLIEGTYTMALRFKTFTVNNSFAASSRHAGLTSHMRHQLAQIFIGTVNFSKDLHPQDRFSILYEEFYKNGAKDHPGNIIAATFQHNNKTYQAIRYAYPNAQPAYYTPKGRGVEPLFLRAPLHYKRISSRFTYHRLDPYTHRWHSHLGVDYAAHVNTPVKSIGDGHVVFDGRDAGYGNAVIIQYGHRYRALYGHLRHFAKHLHPGEYVHKGQVIGYVGETGWATGPHLHFSFYIHGIPHNYLKMHFRGNKKIPRHYRHDFLNKAKSLLAELKFYQGIEIAKN